MKSVRPFDVTEFTVELVCQRDTKSRGLITGMTTGTELWKMEIMAGWY